MRFSEILGRFSGDPRDILRFFRRLSGESLIFSGDSWDIFERFSGDYRDYQESLEIFLGITLSITIFYEFKFV